MVMFDATNIDPATGKPRAKRAQRRSSNVTQDTNTLSSATKPKRKPAKMTEEQKKKKKAEEEKKRKQEEARKKRKEAQKKAYDSSIFGYAQKKREDHLRNSGG